MTANAAPAEHPGSDPLPKTARFRRLLTAPETAFIIEAHNGPSARIVEEAAFQGIWASGVAMSTALGVRDNNEAMEQDGSLGEGDVPSRLNRLVAAGHPVRVRYITGQWRDIDDAPDRARARNLP